MVAGWMMRIRVTNRPHTTHSPAIQRQFRSRTAIRDASFGFEFTSVEDMSVPGSPAPLNLLTYSPCELP
jgi:hypothetical protein